jgi:hypothetical protein
MADRIRRIVRVVIGSADPSQEGIWLDDGSRLQVGDYAVTTGAAYANRPALHTITIRVTDPNVPVQIHAYPEET